MKLPRRNEHQAAALKRIELKIAEKGAASFLQQDKFVKVVAVHPVWLAMRDLAGLGHKQVRVSSWRGDLAGTLSTIHQLDLSDEAKANIMGGTARRLLKLA